MKRGLVIGKFMPLHLGHIALIRFAAAQCDELIVSMSYTPDDAINSQIRFAWIREILKDQPSIRSEMVLDDFDDESLPIRERTKIWATFIKNKFPPVDLLFSSEEYGEPFAEELGIPHIAFDIQRGYVPVSATLIRERPFHYWKYIPEIVQPYFVKLICFYGPESTGKTMMAQRMAELYQTEYVPEVAREMITSNNFTAEDIVKIGYAQTERILKKVKSATKILFCDTDLITTQIYSRQYLHQVPPVLVELETQVNYERYFLFGTDVPWVADGLRDLGDRREEMFTLFRNELSRRKLKFTEIHGTFKEREIAIRREIDKLLL